MKPSINSTADTLNTQILVVGGGTGGTAAAIQSARRGAQTILVSDGPWLGGMLTSAGVCAPDGNELSAFQTGLWGAFIKELMTRESEGLDHGWVSFFTYHPAIGAAIFADWVQALPNLSWKTGLRPQKLLREGDRITGVVFDDLTITADIVIDGTELGELLALGDIPHRLGWELQSEWDEPSAPTHHTQLTETYPVQAPTWVFYLKDGGPPSLPKPTEHVGFRGAWDNYSPQKFMGYGAIPNGQYMMNWPIKGNDYGDGIHRLFGSAPEQQAFLEAAYQHSQAFAAHIIQNLPQAYQLADDMFPPQTGLGGGAFALHPYYRESRRLKGITTVIEQHLLPVEGGRVAALPRNQAGQVTAIAIGNYANDHHYPSGDIPLAPKSMMWGGRWTGTAFTMPYDCLVPETVDGFLVCEKNQSVSHMANGATRLQPVVLGCGQAAGMAAALCVEQGIQPRALNVRSLQDALLNDPDAPSAVIPFYNLSPSHPLWTTKQIEILDHPDRYGIDGDCANLSPDHPPPIAAEQQRIQQFEGILSPNQNGTYDLVLASGDRWQLVTLIASIHQQLVDLAQRSTGETIHLIVEGWPNPAGEWIRVHRLEPQSSEG